jgi:hypothetical protein
MWNGNECAKTRTSRQSSPMQIMIDQIQPESVEYFRYFDSIRNYASEIKASIAIEKQLSTKRHFSLTNST